MVNRNNAPATPPPMAFALAHRLPAGDPLHLQPPSACLAFAQLERFAGQRAARLSGGLKRRLNLAIALLPEPELLVLDEPTVGVDPQSRAFLLDAVRRLADGGAAIIYTSHYMDEIEAIADRVVIVDHGKVVADGTPTELVRSLGYPVNVSHRDIAKDRSRS